MLHGLGYLALTWAACMPLHFRFQAEGKRTLSLLFKGIPTALAASFALAALLRPGADAYARLIFAGLVICTAADVLLEILFPVGGALFFAGHVLYVLAFSLYRPMSWWCLISFVAASAVLEYFLHHYVKDVPDAFTRLGLLVYALALAALLAFGLPLPFLAPSVRSALAALGAALFVISDLTLCHNTIRQKPTSWHFVSLGVYYTGQLLLGLSALRVP